MENFPRRANAQEVLISQKGEELIFPFADGAAKLFGRDYEFREPTLRREHSVCSEDLSGGLQGESEEPRPTESKDDAEAGMALGQIKVTSFIDIMLNFGFNSMCRRKNHSLFHRNKYIDVTRCTHTNLDVMQEKRNDDYWTVDENRNLSDSWIGCTKFTLLKENTPQGHVRSRGRLSKDQTTTRLDHVWPEVWTNLSKAAQRRERQEWTNEEPKLENARKLRGIYLIDLEDKEYPETIKNAEKSGKSRWK